jgi:hypothetical protein
MEEEYKICKQRGHTSDGTGVTMGFGPTYLKCKFCHTKYYFTESQLVEVDSEREVL